MPASTARARKGTVVDSTAAPVATIALFTTWIGFQVGLIGDAVGEIGLERSGFAVFVESLQYAFYPILAVLLVFAIAGSGRDFGPMLAAERRARGGQVLRGGSHLGSSEAIGKELRPAEDTPRRLSNAVVPIVVLIATTLIGLLVTGEGSNLMEIMGDGDAFAALLWGSLLAVIVAGILSVGQRIMSVSQTVESWFSGVSSMLNVVIILTLAWSLSSLAEQLGTAEFLARTLGETIPSALLPAILFVLAAAVAFATGTSWGTMGILTPLAVPLAWAVLQAQGDALPGGHPILFASVSTVLAGAVFGDHCSPISDTTVISSLASQCDVVDHVRTQLPYALYAGAVAVVFGLVPVGLGVPWWLAFPLAIAALLAGLRLLGKRVPDAVPQATEATVADVVTPR